jgi:acetoin utilization deacetylase AcuC-like enzyme
MQAKRETAIVEDTRFLNHCGPDGHPERPDRLTAVRAAVDPQREFLTPIAPRAATPEEIFRVHTQEHFEIVGETAGRGPGRLDADTYVSAESFEVARLAAGGTIDLATRVARGEVATGLAAVRPPGHHAEGTRAMGFCLFNNVAIAARALQADEGVDRILIFDWDVHHGNGTQHSFESDPSVLYASTHQFPFYPGTGAADESGIDAGEGFTLNIPLPEGCGDTEYIGALQHLIVPAALSFRPEVILISCGFDAHHDDPLASMNVTGAGFHAMTAIMRSLSEELCEGRIAYVLEGGYAASGLMEGTTAVLDGMMAPNSPQLPETTPVLSGSVLEQTLDSVHQVHGPKFSKIAAS